MMYYDTVCRYIFLSRTPLAEAFSQTSARLHSMQRNREVKF